MENIKEIAYSKYQLDWMLNHNYSLNDLLNELEEWQNFDLENENSISTPITKVFDDWNVESGFKGGDIWVCFDEFLEYEYRDQQYMYYILNEEEYELYKKDLEDK